MGCDKEWVVVGARYSFFWEKFVHHLGYVIVEFIITLSQSVLFFDIVKVNVKDQMLHL